MVIYNNFRINKCTNQFNLNSPANIENQTKEELF